jgi:hypothetical protein
MSEPIVPTPSAQVENAPTTSEPDHATPEAAVQTAAVAAAEKAAEAEEQAREEAEQTAKAVVRAYRKGESAYRAGLLEAGRLADSYLHQRMTLGGSSRGPRPSPARIAPDTSEVAPDGELR